MKVYKPLTDWIQQTGKDMMYPPSERIRSNVGDQVLNDIEGLRSALIASNEPIPMDLEVFNSALLSPGMHEALSTEKPATLLSGIPGTRIARSSTLGGFTLVDGMIFEPESGSDSVLVTVPAGARTIFKGCTFARPYNDPTSNFAEIEATGKAVFLGCLFLGTGIDTGVMSAAVPGVIVLNDGANAATDCQIAYSINVTGWGATNCTTVGAI